MDTVYQEEKVSAALPLRAGGPAGGGQALPRGIPPALGCSYWATQREARRGGQARGSEGLCCSEAGAGICLFVACRSVPSPAAVRPPPQSGGRAVLVSQSGAQLTKAPEELGVLGWVGFRFCFVGFFFNIETGGLWPKKRTDAKSLLHVWIQFFQVQADVSPTKTNKTKTRPQMFCL